MTEVFEGITVLDFSWGWPGSIATMIMSDYGAEVIKVEPPGGDPFRSWPASLQWNRGKKSVILDLKSPQGRDQAQQLAQQTDVVVMNFRPGVAERLGIGYQTLSTQRPDLVYLSISGFGPKGPYAQYKGYDGVVAAKIGRMMTTPGLARKEGPHYMAVNVGCHGAAMSAVQGICAALYVRDRTGRGQKVETSLLQGITVYDLINWVVWQLMIKFPEQFPTDPLSDAMRMPFPGYLPVRTKDGRWIQMGNLVPRLFQQSLRSLGLGHILEEPRFQAAPMLMPEDQAAAVEMMLEKAQEKTADEWMSIFTDKDTPIAADILRTTQEGMSHPQIIYNGHVQEVWDPRVGKMLQLGPLVDLQDTPGSIKGPAPDPGQHTKEVLDRLASSPRRAPAPPPKDLPRYPLEGVNILDLSAIITGPMGCSLVGQLGARVIRVESPEGDFMRANFGGIMTFSTMAGGEDICIDLKTPEGQEIALKLAAEADILVHNWRPGVAERLGMGYEHVKQINPRLIYLQTTGYGATGPHSHRPSTHPIFGAVCGGALAQLGGGVLPPPDQPMTMDELKEMSRRLFISNEANPDPSSSLVVATALLLALYAREKTGKGQYINNSMLSPNAYANADDFFWYEGKPQRQLSDSMGYGLNALYRLYKVDKGWIFLACLFEEEWQALCSTLGRSDLLEDSRFATPEARQEHDEALAQELASLFATKEALEWERLLTAADVACVQAEDRGLSHFFCEDPHVQENNFISEVELPMLGEAWRYGPVINFSDTSTRVGTGPLKGQHTQAILKEMGYSEDQINDFKARSIVNWEGA